jgi:hypothetical protein
MNSKSYERGLDGESTSRDVLDTLTSNAPTEDQRESFEQGRADRARIEAEKEAREESEK